MAIHKIDKIASYVLLLNENPKEIEILFKELLIGVTNFFRDAAVWEKLKETIFPAIITKLQPGSILRAWIPGCSTGEEAYSLAIVFKEVLEKSIHTVVSLYKYLPQILIMTQLKLREKVFPCKYCFRSIAPTAETIFP